MIVKDKLINHYNKNETLYLGYFYIIFISLLVLSFLIVIKNVF